jgi:hypothetical protein
MKTTVVEGVILRFKFVNITICPRSNVINRGHSYFYPNRLKQINDNVKLSWIFFIQDPYKIILLLVFSILRNYLSISC